MDRRSSDSSEPSRRDSNPNVFDDDYEIDPDENDFMPSVSDGFRPANTINTSDYDRHDRDRQDVLQRHMSTSKQNDTSLRRMATRNSTAKNRDSIAQDPRIIHTRGPSSSSPLTHRASVSSTGSFATTTNGENPFETGPSHPYGMYPQNTMVRTASVATASTEQTPHRPMSLQRPAHPYAMYSQSGLDEEPPEEPVRPAVPPIQTAIPVGFPGHTAGYHRVLGPDGEEQDIIGPDGHTEQLPPYSRYPEQGPTKASLAAEASASRILPAPTTLLETEDPFATPVSPVSPLSSTSFSAPTLPSAPLLPSVTPARLPPRRPETQTGSIAESTSVTASVSQIPAEPSDSSSASLLTTDQVYNEKEESDEPKPKWYKKKLWGRVPVWIIVAISAIFLILIIVLGVAIGTLLTKKASQNSRNKFDHDRPNDEPLPQITGSHRSYFDASPIPTPPGLGALPTGGFSLPLGIPQESNPGCLTQANQYSAWSCKLSFAPLLVAINDTMTSQGPQQVVSIRDGASVPDGAILYGLQTPALVQQQLQLVLDLDYKAFGPAFHFSTRYDKLVILRPDELNPGPSGKQKRDDKAFRQRFQVKPGDLPWYCYWNQTYIEGYIYVQDNSTAASYTSFPSSSGSLAPTFDPAATFTALATPPPTTFSAPTPVIPVVSATSVPLTRRDVQSDASSMPRLPPYPRIFKIEERRLPDSPQPYCQQMVLLDNGKIAPAPNGNDGPKKVWLQAVDPTYEEYSAAEATGTPPSIPRRDAPSLQARTDPSDACHCQWMFK